MPIYSHSRLSTFENCPLKFKFQYIDKIKPEEPWTSVEAFMGSRAHDAFEKLYRDLNLTKLNTLDELLEYFDETWDKEWGDDVRIVRKEYTKDDYRNTGKKCIIDYYNHYKPFDDSKTLNLEQRVTIEIEGHKLTGFIDRLSQRGEGEYEIRDYKTNANLPTQEKCDSDRQLALYQIGVEDMWNDAKSVDLVWHFLRHNKEIRSTRTADEITQLKLDIVSLIEEAEKAEEEDNFPACESGLCGWCEFQMLCPNHAHLAFTQDMPTNEFLKEPGVDLVNRYAELMAQKKVFMDNFESEIAKLKEALIVYAQKENVEVVRGSDKKLRVKATESYKFPRKDSPERAELDELIKKEDKWLEVSDLNASALAKALKEGVWSPKLVKKILEYQNMERDFRFSLSRLKERK
jgi:putative RecB family exonuclease